MHLILVHLVIFHPIWAAQHPILAERCASSLDYWQRSGCTSPPVYHGHNHTVSPRIGRPNNPMHPHLTTQPQNPSEPLTTRCPTHITITPKKYKESGWQNRLRHRAALVVGEGHTIVY